LQGHTRIRLRRRTATRAVAAILTVALTVTHATGCTGFVLFRNVSGVDGPSESQARRLLALTESSATPVRVAIYSIFPNAWRRSQIAASVRVALEGLGAQVSDNIEPPTSDVRSVLLVVQESPHFAPMFASMPLFAVTLSLFPFFAASTYRVRAFELTPRDSTMDTDAVPEPPFSAESDELREALGRYYADETMARLGNPTVIRSATAERRLSGCASLFPTPWMSSKGEKAGATGGQLFEEYEPRVIEALAIEALAAVLQQ
jgi:hypothetical protein